MSNIDTKVEDTGSDTVTVSQQPGNTDDGSQDWRLTIFRAVTHQTQWGVHDFCLSQIVTIQRLAADNFPGCHTPDTVGSP